MRAYLTSTWPPASSIFFLISAASSFGTPSLIGLGRALDELLGLLETEAGDRADLLDHLDLLVAEGEQDDVELGPSPRRRPRRPAGRGHGHGRGGGDAPLLLEERGELGGLHDGEARERSRLR